MKQLFTTLILIAFAYSLQAQQAAQYSLYMFNKLNYNPSYAGLDHSLSATGIYRKQWQGLEGSPTTQSFNVHMPLYMIGGGIGINVENDVLGAERLTTATLAYSWQRDIGNGIFAAGLSGGIVQRSLDGAKLRTPDGNYLEDVPDHADNILPIGTATASVPSFSAGVYYQSEKFEVGLAARHLAEQSAELGLLNLKLTRNYFFNFGLNLDVSRSVSIHPSLLVKSDFVQTQTEISTLVRYNDNIFLGGSFRGYNTNSIDAVVILAGFKLSEKITLAYAYDLTLSELSVVSNGSHEIMLNYNLNKRIGAGKPPRIIYNPRLL